MQSQELRSLFLRFFEERGHVIVPSSSLIPDDPSVLLTTAGMQQFKPYYTGELDPMSAIHGALGRPLGSKNAVSIQKSFRTSDIDEVGDESHLTFFEMLGNFSFGGYFKREAIEWAWEFVHHVLNIPLERVKISVFEGDAEVPADKESHDIWRRLGIPDEKITFGNREDNFWGPTGNEGPCGPTTEIYVDGVELWNIVFNEYYMHPDKRLGPLKIKGVDTGMGLERLSLVMQYPEHPERTIFETDLFKPIMDRIPDTIPQRERRIMADHSRAIAFLISDGVRPSNKEQGYVLRRLMRRIIVHEYLYYKNAQAKFSGHSVLEATALKYKDLYDNIDANIILGAWMDESIIFTKKLDSGLQKFNDFAFREESRNGKVGVTRDQKILYGNDAFYFYQTFGFPREVMRDLCFGKGIRFDEEGFEQAFKRHQEISRAGKEQKFGGHGLAGVSDAEARKDPDVWKMARLHTATHLLHQALHDILGEGIKQMGSDINPERTRFDFSFDRKVAPEELAKIENMVNEKIKEDLPVKREVMPYEEAIRQGARAFFKEKYPPEVSVYSIGTYSRELCGGPHVSRTGEIGGIKILKEEAVGAGVRRIRAALLGK